MAASRRPDRPLLAARRADSWDACCHRAAGSGFEREGISPPDTAPFRHSGEQAGHECESGKRGHAKRVGCDRAVVLFRSASTPVVPSNALTYAARGLCHQATAARHFVPKNDGSNRYGFSPRILHGTWALWFRGGSILGLSRSSASAQDLRFSAKNAVFPALRQESTRACENRPVSTKTI